MNRNSTLILEKLVSLKKYDGAFKISIDDYSIIFSKEFLKKIIYCELILNENLLDKEQFIGNSIENISFKINDKKYFKNYKLTENLKIIEDIEYIFKKIYNLNYARKIKIEDLIKYPELNKFENVEGHQNLKLKTQKAKSKNYKPNPNQTVNAEINYKYIFIACFVIFLIFIGINSENKVSDIGSEAYLISKRIIKSELLTPSVAEFGSFHEAKVINLGNNEYDISNYVDTQNMFGANIRKYYNVKLKYKSGEWSNLTNWEIENIDIE